jgi:hypothetical protein
VDTIEWCREEIRTCDEILAKGRKIFMGEIESDKNGNSDNVSVAESLADSEGAKGKEVDGKTDGDDLISKDQDEKKEGDAKAPKEGNYPALSSAFITFNQQIAAHMGKQVLSHHEPYR